MQNQRPEIICSTFFQYLGLGVELLSPSNRSTMKQQQRQTSQRAQDFEQLKQQMASPESESASENADVNSTDSLLFSNVIIQSRQVHSQIWRLY